MTEENNKFDHLLPKMTNILMKTFMEVLSHQKEFRQEVNTAPFLNMTIGTFIGALVNMLDQIKETTEGEDKLINNIELAKNNLIKAIEDLPFITGVLFK